MGQHTSSACARGGCDDSEVTFGANTRPYRRCTVTKGPDDHGHRASVNYEGREPSVARDGAEQDSYVDNVRYGMSQQTIIPDASARTGCLIGVRNDAEAIQHYLERHAQAAKTSEKYEDVLHRFGKWCEMRGIGSMGELSVAQAYQFQADLAAGDAPSVARNEGEQGGGKRGGVLIALSEETVDHYVGIVKTFMDYLLRAGYLRSNPFFAVEGLSGAKRSRRPRLKVRTLDDATATELFEAVETFPRHGPRFLGAYHQARWVLSLSVRAGLSAREIAEGSMDHFHCSQNEWSLVVHAPGADSKLVSVSPALLDDLLVYRSWMRSASQLWKLAALPHQPGDVSQLPLVGLLAAPHQSVEYRRVVRVIAEIVSRTVKRLERDGRQQSANDAALLSLRRSRATQSQTAKTRPQRLSPTALGAYVGHADMPPGPKYL